MPRTSNGIYDLPPNYLAVSGETINPQQHNAPLEDIAQALTASLPRNGSAPMTAPLKLADGSADAPSLAFNAMAGLGLYRTPDGLAVAVGGMKVAEFTAGEFIATAIGSPVFLLDDTLPPLCVWAGGQNLSRTTYARLFAKWGTKYGAGDGTTTFSIPDWRGCAPIGSDKNGGTDANQLAGVPVVSGSRITAGSVIGGNLHTLSANEMPSHLHNNVTVYGSVTDLYPIGTTYTFSDVPGWQNNPLYVMTTLTSTPEGFVATGQTGYAGGGAAHNNVPRSLVCNVAIYAGA